MSADPKAALLTDAICTQLISEACSAHVRAYWQAVGSSCTPKQATEIAEGARAETVRSFLYQLGVLEQKP